MKTKSTVDYKAKAEQVVRETMIRKYGLAMIPMDDTLDAEQWYDLALDIAHDLVVAQQGMGARIKGCRECSGGKEAAVGDLPQRGGKGKK